jgi:nucleoside-diphosphate-sugar epimerase
MTTSARASLAGRRVLVTGASGFLGTHVCARLRAAGAMVHATSRQPRQAGADGITFRQADVADIAAARELLATVSPDIVYHLSGAVGASPDLSLVLPTYHSLLTSTVNLLVAATEHGCSRVVLTGSLTEPAPIGPDPIPRSPYGAAKAMGVAYGQMFHALYRTPVVILRPFMTYGPAQASTKLIPSTILSLLGGKPPLLSSGKVRADFVYVDDVADAFLAAAVMPGIEGASFDLGSGALVSIRHVVEQLARLTGSTVAPQFGALPDRPGENEIAANTAPAAWGLDWAARTPLEEGLERTIAWYRARL